MAYDIDINDQIMQSSDLVETTEYESAAADYINIADEDLSQAQYKDRRRVIKITYSSIVIGYKTEQAFLYRYARDHRKFCARQVSIENTIKI